MTMLALMRHGATDWTERGLLQGRADRPLSPAGRAEVAGWRLPADLAGFDLVSSPLLRCVETARLLVGEPLIDDRLVEADWGAWEGRSLAALRRADPEGMAAAEARGLDLEPPGGESPRRVQDRLRPWLAERSGTRRPTLAVTHKGVIRAAYALWTGWDMTVDPPEKLGDGKCHIFRLGPGGAITVERLNIPMVGQGDLAPSHRGGRDSSRGDVS
ncbi:MAG TPA: histidine phosphatase family protein [Alphaproteobacteria bacterium]|nr:histidine phosphatase family protein [Alphaproteobacteria bacterium]